MLYLVAKRTPNAPRDFDDQAQVVGEVRSVSADGRRLTVVTDAQTLLTFEDWGGRDMTDLQLGQLWSEREFDPDCLLPFAERMTLLTIDLDLPRHRGLSVVDEPEMAELLEIEAAGQEAAWRGRHGL